LYRLHCRCLSLRQPCPLDIATTRSDSLSGQTPTRTGQPYPLVGSASEAAAKLPIPVE
jgi:hypothetical protein